MAFIKRNIISMTNCTEDGFGFYAIDAGKVMITTRDTATNPPLIEQWYCNATAGERVSFLGDYSRFILFDFSTTDVGVGTAGVSSFNGRPGAVMPQAGDYNAGQIAVTPTGDVAATNLQAAIGELSTEKASVAALNALTTTVTNITNGTTAVPTRHSTLNNDEPQRHVPTLTTAADYLRGDGTFATFPTTLPPGPHTHAHSALTQDEQTRHVATSGGVNGYVLMYDNAVAGTNNKWAAIPTPLVFESKTEAFTAVKGRFYDVYLSAPLTITLPATPTVEDEISFRITGASATNILTFARNGENIENIADDGFVTGNGTISIKYTGTIGANNVGWDISKGQLV